MSLDVGPVNVRGAVRASRARVIWHDGTLIVVHSASRIQRIASSEPVQKGTAWKADTDEGLVSFSRRGCSSCGWKLGRIDRQELIG